MKARVFKTPALLLCAMVAGALTTAGCVGNAEPVKEAAAHTLVNTHWRLTLLGDEVIDNPPAANDVHIVLQEANSGVTGNAGCNRMFGRYVLNGDSMKFAQIGGTKMFCQARMDLEQKFLGVFEQVSSWKITGKTLQLLDGAGKVVGTFEAT